MSGPGKGIFRVWRLKPEEDRWEARRQKTVRKTDSRRMGLCITDDLLISTGKGPFTVGRSGLVTLTRDQT